MYADRDFRDAHAPSQAQTGRALKIAETFWGTPHAMRALAAELGSAPLAFLTLFVTPKADIDAVMSEARSLFPGIDIVACTTAGELGRAGYEEGKIIAIGFPAEDFASTSTLIRNIGDLDAQALVDEVTLARLKLEHENKDFAHGFAFVVVDGLSLSEDAVMAALAPALAGTPVFGGSAGDGTNFRSGHTWVALNGDVVRNAAVLTLVRTRRRMKVFSLDHLIPTELQMVVTEADPARRVVKSINAEPAAREYARIVGKDPEQLDRFTFAAHPVAVRIGDEHHVRAIQQITETGEMVFFSAVDEGMVLSVARADDMVAHLQRKLAALSQNAAPTDIIGCDCVLRRIEAEQNQMTRSLSDLLSRHNVIGFSTYGEQIGPLHVNHTMSGVAFYPPDAAE